jgi:hypothetical protein
MTKPKWTDSLDNDLNADRALADMAQRLRDADFSASRLIRYELRQELLRRINAREASASQPVRPTRTLSARRKLAYAVVMLGLLALIVWSVPPLRSFAQDVIRTVGKISITDKPTWVEQQNEMLAQGTPLPTFTPVTPNSSRSPRLLSLEEASQEAGFQALAPGYVPSGYALSEQAVFTDDDETQVSIFYDDEAMVSKPGPVGPNGRDFLIIQEMRWREGAEASDWSVGSAHVTDVTVRDQPGIWVEGMVSTVRTDQITISAPGNMLLWEENGLTIVIQTHSLPLDEMLKVAESLSAHPEEVAAQYQATAEAAAAQISAQAGYPIYQPEQLPAGYRIESCQAATDHGLTLVRTRYRKSNRSDTVDVVQIPLDHPSVGHLWALRDAGRARHATINGAPAFWVSLLPSLSWLELPPDLDLTTRGALIWQMDGYLFMIQSESLPLDTLLQMGGSMVP